MSSIEHVHLKEGSADEEVCYISDDNISQVYESKKCVLLLLASDITDPQSFSNDELSMDTGEDEKEDQIIFEDDSCQCFYGHNNEPIYSLATFESNVISGGGDDFCYLWDSSTGERIFPESFSEGLTCNSL